MPDNRELYKTKLCNLFQRGNCHRQTCSFAHGEEELRRAPGRSGYHSRRSDDRFSRRYDRRSSYDRGASRSRSPTRRASRSPSSPRSTGQKRSGSNLDRDGDGKRVKGDRVSELSEVRALGDGHSDGKEVQSNSLNEQLQEVGSELEALDKKKSQLETSLQNVLQENSRIASRNAEAESKISTLAFQVKSFERLRRSIARVFRLREELKAAEWKFDKEAADLARTEDIRFFDPPYDGDYSHSKWNRSNGDIPPPPPPPPPPEKYRSNFSDDFIPEPPLYDKH